MLANRNTNTYRSLYETLSEARSCQINDSRPPDPLSALLFCLHGVGNLGPAVERVEGVASASSSRFAASIRRSTSVKSTTSWLIGPNQLRLRLAPRTPSGWLAFWVGGDLGGGFHAQ
jgi:hypothetical protein